MILHCLSQKQKESEWDLKWSSLLVDTLWSYVDVAWSWEILRDKFFKRYVLFIKDKKLRVLDDSKFKDDKIHTSHVMDLHIYIFFIR